MLTIAFIIIVLLGVVIFQNLVPRGGGANADSPAMKSLKADIETRRSALNRERLALGLDPLPGADGLETPEQIANRLTTDAETLAALAASFQDMLSRKEAQIDAVRADSVAALKEQNRLRELLTQTTADLQRALIDASLANTLKADLDKANAAVAALNQQLAAAGDEPGQLREQLIESNRRRNELEARVAELEERLRRATLFADSESELIKEAVALFRALRKLEGASESELASAYSRFGAQLGAEVLKTCSFATGSAEIQPDLESNLRTIPAEAPEDAMILAVGYASETGNVDHNRTLSSDRATAVAQLLDTIKRPGQRVQAVFLGQTDRFSAKVPTENQRVEIWQILPKAATEPVSPDGPAPAPASSDTENPAAPPLRPIPNFD
jgi:outer membrane protein OmpA-like peptidoglycan-associated protein